MLKDIPNKRSVFAWGMYDLANQSFQLLINTLLFGVYVQKVVAASEAGGKQLWSLIVAAALLIVVVLSPIVGAITDARGWKHELLCITGFIAALLTALLALVPPGQAWLASLIYIPAAVLVGLGENVLAAFLPQLATARNMGLVSAVGWTMSYIGAIILQLIVLIAALALGLKEPAQWRPLFVFAGVWFALGIIPAVMYLRDPDRPRPAGPGAPPLLAMGFSRVRETFRDARRYRQLLRFLAVFFVYSLGTQTVVYFAGSIATDLKFSTQELFLLSLVLSISAGATSFGLAKFQDRLGGARTVSLFLLIWTVTAGGLAIMTWLAPSKPVFWILALGVGIGLGGIGSSSRALVGCFTPIQKSAEFFGLWGMIYKLSGVVGPVVFAQVWVAASGPAALLVLTGFFAAGLVLMRLIDEREGIAAAETVAEPRPIEAA